MYKGTYTIGESGSYTMYISINLKIIVGSPFDIQINPGIPLEYQIIDLKKRILFIHLILMLMVP